MRWDFALDDLPRVFGSYEILLWQMCVEFILSEVIETSVNLIGFLTYDWCLLVLAAYVCSVSGVPQ